MEQRNDDTSANTLPTTSGGGGAILEGSVEPCSGLCPNPGHSSRSSEVQINLF